MAPGSDPDYSAGAHRPPRGFVSTVTSAHTNLFPLLQPAGLFAAPDSKHGRADRANAARTVRAGRRHGRSERPGSKGGNRHATHHDACDACRGRRARSHRRQRRRRELQSDPERRQSRRPVVAHRARRRCGHRRGLSGLDHHLSDVIGRARQYRPRLARQGADGHGDRWRARAGERGQEAVQGADQEPPRADPGLFAQRAFSSAACDHQPRLRQAPRHHQLQGHRR